jgi:HSP20 family protein
MALIPWKNKREAEGAAAPLHALRSEMDRLFDAFFGRPLSAMEWQRPAWWGREPAWMPAVDISEHDNEVTVRAEVPGVDPKDLEVTVTGNQLVLRGEKKESTEQKGLGFYQSETHYGEFHRTVPLPEGVDAEHVEAQYANGVLTLRMKKKPRATAKRIDVKIS